MQPIEQRSTSYKVALDRGAALIKGSIQLALFVLCLILCGCDVGRSKVGEPQTIRSGNDRLTLRWAPDQFNAGFDFDSVVWETRSGNDWGQRAIITRKDFESGTDRRRWICELHSFNPDSGDAIIKVAEGDAPEGSKAVNFIYSWREWSMLTNGEVRFIRVCIDPFEKY